jgi:hypothetical protein
MALTTVEVSVKDTKAFVDLLTASAEFFSWYNKTYQQQPSSHDDHPWCKLGSVLDNLSGEAESDSTLGEALPKEIERCQELLAEYKTIPTGAFGAAMIKQDIKAAHKAMIEQDLPAMIRAYEALKGCN